MSLLPNWLTGYDEDNARAAEAANERLQQLNAQTYGPAYTPRDTQTFGVQNQREQIDEAFTDELDARASAIIGGPLRVVGNVMKSVVFAIPVWVWLVAGTALFFYLGGGPWLRKFIKQKMA